MSAFNADLARSHGRHAGPESGHGTGLGTGPESGTGSGPAADRDLCVVAEGLTRRFGDFTAVDGVSFQVPYGRIYGFLGPNGAGKTTTIRMLLGIVRPTEGRAVVLGYDVAHRPQDVQSRVGYVSQRFGLYDDLTVRENLDFYGRTYGVGPLDLDARRRSVVERIGLVGHEDELARELAGGYRQRLALACAILHDPPLLFLDEPTAGVDPISRRAFWDYLYDLADAGRTIFVTTHYMDEAESCHRLAFILGGRLVEEGSPGELKERMPGLVLEIDAADPDAALGALVAARDEGRLPLDEVTFYGDRVHATVPGPEVGPGAVAEALAAAGVEARAVQQIPPSLEDVFIASVRRHRAAGDAA